MKITIRIETEPYGAEDDIYNTLQDAAFQEDLEVAVENCIEQIMGWRDIEVRAAIVEMR